VILPRFDPEQFAHAVQTHGGTHSFMVPTMLQMLVDASKSVRNAVQSMRQISFGGAPITNTAFARALDAFGPILTQVYGTSEAPHPVTVLRPDDYVTAPDPSALAETAGRASLASEIRVVNDDGEPLPTDGEGELLVRGEYVMQRYWRDERATDEVFDRDGWYKTGDIAVVDKAGFVRFKDRKRDLIISGGLNIYPSEVERVLAPHPNVREVAVIGYPDDRWGESVMACVVPTDPATVSEQELINWLEGRIAGYKKPRRVVFMSELPKGTTNKVLKRELREKLWEGRSRRIN
jgi:acyl-CoA synthetase (AMP-forming)/AMP-acid ligase II